MARQLALDLGRAPSHAAEMFLTSACNARAFALIDDWPNWPDRTLVMVGPPGSGKSHLAAIWAEKSSASIARPGTVFDLDQMFDGGATTGRAILLEDADRAKHPESALFHLMNSIRERQGWLLVTARRHPDNWGLTTPDVLSRLRLAPLVCMEAPDATLIAAVMVKLFADRQIRVDPDVIAYATRHGDQTLDAVSRFVSEIDEAALSEGRRITRPLAIQTLARLKDDQYLPDNKDAAAVRTEADSQGPT